MSNVAQYNEAIEKAAQTADLLLDDLKALYPLAKCVAEEVLLFEYIAKIATIRGTLGRIAAENMLK